jgi:UDP-glucuronate 4-epimerase
MDRIPRPDPNWSGDKPDPATSNAPYRLYNIGNHTPVALLDFIATIEKAVGKPAKKNLLPMQPGDVHATYADVSELKSATGFEPKTPLDEGIKRFVAWYRAYYRV